MPTIIIEHEDVKMRFDRMLGTNTWNYSVWHDDHWLSIPLHEPMESSDVLWNCNLAIVAGMEL
jgi:hypothetical protein